MTKPHIVQASLMNGDNTSSIFEAARALPTDAPMVLLFSGMHSQGSGNHSFLAHDAEATLHEGGFAALEAALRPADRWFGYLGYGLGHALEQLPTDCAPPIQMPDLWMMKPRQVQIWHHPATSTVLPIPSIVIPALSFVIPAKAGIQKAVQTVKKHGCGRWIGWIPAFAGMTKNNEGKAKHNHSSIKNLRSNFTKSEYLATIERTIIQIKSGAFYQANITRKFYGEFTAPPNTLALFERLCAISPAPYASYLRTPFGDIISSSPEGFVQLDAQGILRARPIKGSAPRGATPQQDAAIKAQLANSHKDLAENLMIVDLMRNDLSRICKAGTIQVEALQHIHSFETIHQMISTISGQKRPECSALDAVKACFPAGSMTGAPKVAAMKWCAAQEKVARGVYSGAIGWVDGAGLCDLSVVIRTLIIQGNRFEFQVGGGIVADSNPEEEWAETMTKAKAIAELLGIEMARLEGI